MNLNRGILLCCVAAGMGATTSLGAQMVPSARFLDVGSERERVLRVLQLTGDVPLYPWSIRGFSPAEWDWLTPRAPNGQALLPPESRQRRLADGAHVVWLPAEAGAIYNSTFPYGFNDGAVWAGKGFTGFASAGIAARYGPVSLQLEPLAFDAANAAFGLRPTGIPEHPFLNASYPTTIDLPQRFGSSSYGRFDLGQSSLRLDLGPVAAELSTANQWWGPAQTSPLILGDNAAGFPHLFIGTSHPAAIGIGTLHGRVEWGELTQSAFAPANAVASRRFMAGVIALFTPHGVPGLEIGGARFFHTPWPEGGLSRAPFGRPFEGLLKYSLASSSNPAGNRSDNQLASAFFRWAFPRAGFEAYGEIGREDHNQDIRDLWQEPDHNSGFMLGLQRAWKRRDGSVIAARGEVLNTRLSALQQGRGQAPWYVHTLLTQGHTQLGQTLGAAGAFGGGGATIGVDEYTAAGRWTVEWNRTMLGEARNADGLPVARAADVMHSLGVERQYNLPTGSVGLRGNVIWDLNRDFSGDAVGLNLVATFRRIF
jgi:hypothetical protein